jgi:hypothetical protein
MRKTFFIVFSILLIFSSAGFAFLWEQDRREKSCFENIEILEKAKMRFGAEYGAGLGSMISMKVVESVIGPASRDLRCPNGGEYTINPVGEPVTCSIHGCPEKKQPRFSGRK